MSVYCYGGILREAERIAKTEFISYSLQRLICLKKEMKSIYDYEKRRCVPTATESYNIAMDYVTNLIYSRLSQVVGLSNDSISQIETLTESGDVVTDIECVEGMTLVKSVPNSTLDGPINKDSIQCNYAVNKAYSNVTNTVSVDDNNKKSVRFLIRSLDNAIKPLLGNIEEDNIFSINGSEITCNVPELEVLSNRNLYDVLINANEKVVAKVVVRYNDQLFAFDIKMRNGCLVIMEKPKTSVFSVLKRQEEEIKRVRTQANN